MVNQNEVQTMPEAGIQNEKIRNGFIELCRFIFMLCIVSHHALYLRDYGHIPMLGGYIAVEFFFLLTGFFLAKQSEKGESETWRDTLRQAVKPIRGIYGYFFISWLASFIIWHVLNNKMHLLNILYDLVRGVPQLLMLSIAGLGGATDGLWDYVGTAWYLQALLIAILVCYPLMRRWKNSFFAVGAPLLAILIYGKIMLVHNSFGVVNESTDICNLGIFRAIAGLSLGSFCYYISKQMPKLRLTAKGNVILSTMQIMFVGLVLILMDHYSGFNDVIEVLLFAGLIVLSMSSNTSVNQTCNNRICHWLGKFASVIFITQSLTYMYPILPYPDSWIGRYLAHFGYILAVSLLNMLLVTRLQKLFKKVKFRKLIWDTSDRNV